MRGDGSAPASISAGSLLSRPNFGNSPPFGTTGHNFSQTALRSRETVDLLSGPSTNRLPFTHCFSRGLVQSNSFVSLLHPVGRNHVMLAT